MPKSTPTLAILLAKVPPLRLSRRRRQFAESRRDSEERTVSGARGFLTGKVAGRGKVIHPSLIGSRKLTHQTNIRLLGK
jgi:hypothetical protein